MQSATYRLSSPHKFPRRSRSFQDVIMVSVRSMAVSHLPVSRMPSTSNKIKKLNQYAGSKVTSQRYKHASSKGMDLLAVTMGLNLPVSRLCSISTAAGGMRVSTCLFDSSSGSCSLRRSTYACTEPAPAHPGNSISETKKLVSIVCCGPLHESH